MQASRTLEAHRWYKIGVIMSVIGMVFGLISVTVSRVGYPFSFMCTMMAVIAISIPAWDLPKNRTRLVITNFIVLLIEVAILTVGLAATQS